MYAFFKQIIRLVEIFTMTRIYSIEGNIGSGKSTLVSILQSNSNDKPIVFLLEPVDEWETIKDAEGNTMLQKFYSDQEKYSFPFQMMAYISRLALLKKTVEKNQDAIIITERSLYTDKFVFAKMLYASNMIEDVNYQIYLKWFDTFAKDYPITGIIYVSSSPDTCKERIQKRSRDGEDTISIDYLAKCNEYHDSMIYNYSASKLLLVLNGNLDIADMKSTWINMIEEFIY